MAERTRCVVVGGGPAGMVVSLLLARAGVDVTVLEKHGDFLRDFRGDTVHPSTMELLDELGLGERFAKLPQSRLTRVAFPAGDGRIIVVGDLSRLKVRYPYIAMVPQWDLLDLLADAARAEPSFSLRMRCEVTGLIRDDGRVRGVEYRTADGATGEIRADLTIACDGRGSIVRQQAGGAGRGRRRDLAGGAVAAGHDHRARTRRGTVTPAAADNPGPGTAESHARGDRPADHRGAPDGSAEAGAVPAQERAPGVIPARLPDRCGLSARTRTGLRSAPAGRLTPPFTQRWPLDGTGGQRVRCGAAG